MKIAITAQGETLDSPLDPRFGRCAFFLIFDDSQKSVQVVPNAAVGAAHGAGITAAQKVLEIGVQVVLTGNLGPNAFNVLMQGGVKAYRANPGPVSQAIDQYHNNKLPPISLAGPGHAGLSGSGMGRGMGGGRGGGRGRQW